MNLFYPCYNIMDKVDCCSFSFWTVRTSHTFDMAASGTIINFNFISYQESADTDTGRTSDLCFLPEQTSIEKCFMIMRSKNSICIHVDSKADAIFFNALEKLANCFDNVFLAKKREDVIYTSFSMIQVN